jgi:hypothetical protein
MFPSSTRSSSLRLGLLALFAGIPLLAGCPGEQDPCDARGLEKVRWFEDRDRDTFGNLVAFVEDCEQPEGYVEDPTDCDDLRPTVFPGAPEICDGLDNNCNLAADDGLVFQDFWLDEDGDTFGNPQLQIQRCLLPDGAADRPGDCDDDAGAVNPDAIEICDGIDNDCNAFVDDDDEEVDLSTGSIWHPDSDGDGYGDRYIEIEACEAPPGTLMDDSDCNDDDEVINPDNQEVCNGVDDDCDLLYDDSDPDVDVSTQLEWWPDHDADGYGLVGSTSFFTCTSPWYHATNDEDCDDANPLVLSPTTTTWLADADGDGVGTGDASEPSCTPPAATGFASHVAGDDCDDANPDVFPEAIEICNTIDDDCDALIDDDDLWDQEGGVTVESMSPWWVDADLDGFGDATQGFLACAQPDGLVPNPDDCDDVNELVNPGQLEVCNGGVDDDCSGRADDLDPGLDESTAEVFVRDADDDGWGDLNTLTRACLQPDGFVLSFGDCDDADPFITLPSTWWVDADGDLQGAGVPVGPASCSPPDVGYVPRYIDSPADCAPDDALAYTGSEICYDGIDQNCDGNDFVTVGTCQLDLPDTCAEAQLWIPLLPAGQAIQGDLTDATSELNPGIIGCTGDQALAKDEILPLRIPDGATLQALFRIPTGDGSIYLLPSCFSAGSCLAGVDANPSNGSFETLFWTNDTGAEAIVYLVLDGFEPVDSRPFTLTISLVP